MESQAQASPQLNEATPARQNKNQRRGRARKSNNFPQQDGNASDAANVAASPAVASAAQHTPQPPRHQQRHSLAQNNQANSPRNHARNYNANVPATPLREQAYAGPTFHASPDPSSLPIPKFFRLANQTAAPASPAKSSDGEDNSPQASPSKKPANTLDLFFAADRKERAKLEQERQSQALEAYETAQHGSHVQPRPQSSGFGNWREQRSNSPVKDERAPLAHSQQQIHSSPSWKARAGDRPFNGQIESTKQVRPKDPKAMAEDLKRILKIG